MSLDLDKRQRAMLREMGIRLWQPLPTAAEAAAPAAMQAARRAPAGASNPSAPAPAHASALPTATVAAPRSGPAAASAASTPPGTAPPTPDITAAWTLGEARVLYADDAASRAQAGATSTARWLLLVECAAGAASADPLAGDAGKLLDNMLRAARVPASASAVWVPVVRQHAGKAPMASACTALIRQHRPDLILIMGRLAAQALLNDSAPLGKLRSQVHQLGGVPAVVTYDAPCLLRSGLDKAKAWDDLCLAQQLAQQVQPGAAA